MELHEGDYVIKTSTQNPPRVGTIGATLNGSYRVEFEDGGHSWAEESDITFLAREGDELEPEAELLAQEARVDKARHDWHWIKTDEAHEKYRDAQQALWDLQEQMQLTDDDCLDQMLIAQGEREWEEGGPSIGD